MDGLAPCWATEAIDIELPLEVSAEEKFEASYDGKCLWVINVTSRKFEMPLAPWQS